MQCVVHVFTLTDPAGRQERALIAFDNGYIVATSMTTLEDRWATPGEFTQIIEEIRQLGADAVFPRESVIASVLRQGPEDRAFYGQKDLMIRYEGQATLNLHRGHQVMQNCQAYLRDLNRGPIPVRSA